MLITFVNKVVIIVAQFYKLLGGRGVLLKILDRGVPERLPFLGPNPKNNALFIKKQNKTTTTKKQRLAGPAKRKSF